MRFYRSQPALVEAAPVEYGSLVNIRPSSPPPGGFVGGIVQTARHRLLHADPTAAYTRLIRGTFTLFVLLAFGVIGYMIIEDWSFLDALFMTLRYP